MARRKRNGRRERVAAVEQREKDQEKEKERETGKRRARARARLRAKVTEASWPGRFGPVGTRWWPAALIAMRGRDVASSRRNTHRHTRVSHTRTSAYCPLARALALALACRNWRW